MALYDGFFDAVWDEQTETYDRTYDSGDFTAYFGAFVGSGVCVYQNPDSMKVSFRQGKAVVAPGYLFIQGYWLKNDAEYELPLGGAGDYAIETRLNTGLRMIQLEAKPKSQAQPSAESLILAYVTVDSAGAGAAEDTRSDPALCGVIDSAGNVANQAAYAVQYIDTQLEDRLAQAQQQIDQKSAQLEAKIQQVAAVAEQIEPPAIGSIQFSASQNVGPEWLRCDGSFINQQDYPELVQALGKLTPGDLDFWEALAGKAGAGLSNLALYGGACWAYCGANHTLYGYWGAEKRLKEIPVAGAEKLTASAASMITLSIVSGQIFLAQGKANSLDFALLTAEFTGEEQTLALEELPAYEKISQLKSSLEFSYGDLWSYEYAVPEIGVFSYNWGTSAAPDIKQTFGMAVATQYYYYTTGSGSESLVLQTIIWPKEDFAAAKLSNYKLANLKGAQDKLKDPPAFLKLPYRYCAKNQGEALVFEVDSLSNGIQFIPRSYPEELYSTPGDSKLLITNFSNQTPVIASSVAGTDRRYIHSCKIEGGKLKLWAGFYNPNQDFQQTTAGVSFPSRAKVFRDSICYAENQQLWLVFLGCGVAFAQDPLSSTGWGYLDTQETLGVITQMGSIDYDEQTQILYLAGVDSQNQGKLGVLQFPELYHYANDGAWLPSIASDGVPAYIKAREEA